MKVLFINFNLGSTPGINNGLAVLSSVLKEKGHQVRLLFLCEALGYGMDLDRMKSDITAYRPDIIGISLMETQLKYMMAFAEGLRDYYKGFVICGGPYPTMDPEGCLSLKAVDAVCVGEGEDALSELAEAISSAKDPSGIRNLWIKKPDGSVSRNKLRPFKDLKELPPEDKELFDLDRILPLKNYQLEMMVGRGCMYRCSYCINESYLKKYQALCETHVTAREYIRVKDVETVISEIKESIRLHPAIRKIAFIDDNIAAYDGYLGRFCDAYKDEVGLPFMCNVNPVAYDGTKARKLNDSGCDDIRFGVESGSERVKKDILRRPVPNAKVIDAFRINRELGMMTSSFNMIGLPTETREEVLDTLRLNAQISPDTVKVMTFYPFKNTPIYDLCEELGLIDFGKKLELDNYDTFTCLKFPAGHQLFLKKVQAAFNWYLNAFADNESSKEYSRMVEEIEYMDEEQWSRFDFYAADEALSEKMKRKEIPHYSKFVNRSLAVKFPSRHFSEEVADAG